MLTFKKTKKPDPNAHPSRKRSHPPPPPPPESTQDDDADERMMRHDGMHRPQQGYESTAHAMAGIPPSDGGAGYDQQGESEERTAYRNPLRSSGPSNGVQPHASSSSLPLSYDPGKYANLRVSPDVQELFGYIQRYSPKDAEIPAPLKPFVPDYVPAVGDVDEFIKVPRPDGLDDGLGIRVLDEPGATQSDPSTLGLKLRRLLGGEVEGTRKGSAVVGSIARPESKEGAVKLDAWIESVNALHEGDDSKSGGSYVYSKNMPSVETLMQEFDPEVEEALRKSGFPDNLPDNMDINQLAKYMCSVLDIPVYDGYLVESLHLMFSAYLHMKNDPYLHTKGTTPTGKGRRPDSLAFS